MCAGSPPRERYGEVLHAFDTLSAGESLILVGAHEPRQLLCHLQLERPARFDWFVLEAGPERHRVQLRRRFGSGPRNVTEYLQGDHERLDVLIALVRGYVSAGEWKEARARFGEFACGLERHIEAEEGILFPLFERLTGARGGPTVVMRAEHVEIRQRLDVVSAELKRANEVRALDAIDLLVDALTVHNMKEEHVLYPMTDRAAGSDDARASVVRQIQAV